MKIGSVVVGLVLCLMIGLVIAQQRDAGADQVKAAKGTVTVTQTEPMSQVSVFMPEAETYAKKCSFNSDCPYGTCTKNVCGGCSFNSDCKGWGKCSNGWCGSCSFNSDCQGFGSCKNGRCEKSPY